MTELRYVSEDFLTVKDGDKRHTLAWGDALEVIGPVGKNLRVRVPRPGRPDFIGIIKGKKLPTKTNKVLKFSMVDVQQGDGMVLETPAGKKILIDGGDNKLFARHLAARFRGSSAAKPLDVDAIIVTHGDADHFDGLNKIKDTETQAGLLARKRLFLRVHRVFHNGLVKAPSKIDDIKMLGRTVKTRTGRAIVDLYNDLGEVSDEKMNRPFKRWKKTLKHWSLRGEIDMRRLAYGDKAEFAFLKPEGIGIEVLGPIPVTAKLGNKRVAALPFLRKPRKTILLPLDEESGKPRPFSASHTINGHSVALRLTYGNVRFLLTGDLNQESMKALRRKNPDLEAEILKAPHHGSADFDMAALKMIRPVVSLISSGDESARKEHIHPRATLMGALGKVSRGDISIILCTELAAFFAMRGLSKTVQGGKTYFGFERTNFGIIQIRTDGKRVLVFTHSGKENLKEAYRFTVDEEHNIRFARDVKKR